MTMKKHTLKSAISILLISIMALAAIPTAYAAQVSNYVDPADAWLTTGNRTNELDMNAATTYETQYCCYCRKETTMLTYRVPEYTKSGTTALNRGVKYSDGTLLDAVGRGNLDDGLPGVDAYYTGYHFSKSVCQNCGTINAIEGEGNYAYNKNVYALYSCDHKFFLDFDNTTHVHYNDNYHTTTLKKGEYCQFCKGTYARASEKRELHEFEETVDGQIGNNRFYVAEHCHDCEYDTSEYITAKSVVSSYYGIADGEAHTLTVSDLSDSGVKTSIRYGDSAHNCNRTSAPNYTKPGYYTVYYEVAYSYSTETMIENGVSYVWLLDENNSSDSKTETAHSHDYRYLETVPPSCTNLGYERWQCDGCGSLQKVNYTPATGHDHRAVTIREASCKQGALALKICNKCGDFHEETTPIGNHRYYTHKVNPTCKSVGYNEHTCEECGDNYITDITPIISHAYKKTTTSPTCTEKGYTTYTCTMCNESHVSDYTEPTGHKWDSGRSVTSSTCVSEGVTEYACENCSEKMIEAQSATGHNHGEAASCTEPQICLDCNAILEQAHGHSYTENVTAPTCTSLGFTTYTCETCDHQYVGEYTDRVPHDYISNTTSPTCTEMGDTTFECADCGDSYVSDYTDRTPHKYNTVITTPTCTTMGFATYTCSDCGDSYVNDYTNPLGHSPTGWIIGIPATIENAGVKHIECQTCGEILQTAEIPQLIGKDNSDEDGKAEVGAFSIILTDKDGKPIFNSEITIDVEDKISIKLPTDRLLDYADQTTITAFYTGTQAPAANLRIFIYDTNDNAATGSTDENGQLKVPNNQSSTGDGNGTIGGDDEDKKSTFVVTVTDKNNLVIPNCDISIGESNNIVVDLPEGVRPTKDEPVIITVTDQNGVPQQDITVIAIGDADFIEKGVTDIYGKVTLPMANEGYTDENGRVTVGEYIVIVNDEIGFIENAFVTIIDGKISILLPDTHILTTSNQTTVTVTKDNEAVKGIFVTVTDKKKATATKSTDSSGKIVVPVKTSSGGYSSGGGGGGIYVPSTTINVTVTDKDGKNVPGFSKSVDSKGNVTITLPSGTNIEGDNYYTVTLTDSKGAAKSDIAVTLKDKKGNTAEGTTGKDGKVILPVVAHFAYIVGYPDGTFRPDGNMTRAEAAAIFARLISEKKNENASGKPTFNDVANNKWYASYIGYLEKHSIIKGYGDNTFKPNDSISRAEFVSMAVRCYGIFDKVSYQANTTKYSDVNGSYWAIKDISFATGEKWLNGYANGTFKGDSSITRAEAVTVVNRATGRNGDNEYINKNLSSLNKFTDLKNNSYWAFYDIMEAANEHKTVIHQAGESWIK